LGKEGKKEEGEPKRSRGKEGRMLELLRSRWRGNTVLTKRSSINRRQRETFLRCSQEGGRKRKKERKKKERSQW